jgi:hypothetical protein
MMKKFYLVETTANGAKTTREFETEQEAYSFIDTIRKQCQKITLTKNTAFFGGSLECVWTDCTLLELGCC